MSDLSSYRDKAANYGKQANQAEQDKDYQLAFEFYTKALDIFSHMIKCKYKRKLRLTTTSHQNSCLDTGKESIVPYLVDNYLTKADMINNSLKFRL